MEKEIESIEGFLNESFKVQEDIELYNNGWEATHHKGLAFRGHSSKCYELIPSIGRNRKFSCDISILNQERNLIEMAKFKMPYIFRSDLLPIDLLSVEFLHMLMVCDMFVNHRHLSATDSGADIAHAVIVTDMFVLVVGVRLAGLGSIEQDFAFCFLVIADQCTDRKSVV